MCKWNWSRWFQKMIKKARSLDNLGTYFNSDLMSWNPENKVNVVFNGSFILL